jgi:hypothetical protein
MLVPKDFKPPTLKGSSYIARKLCARDVYLDYMAVMSSIEVIKKVRGGNWPSQDLTIEDDLIDLCWHQREFEFMTSFAYTVMNREETECWGCIYFYPPKSEMSSAASKSSAETSVSWWVTQKKYDEGFYEVLCADIKNWVEKEWPFKNVFWANKELPETF